MAKSSGSDRNSRRSGKSSISSYQQRIKELDQQTAENYEKGFREGKEFNPAISRRVIDQIEKKNIQLNREIDKEKKLIAKLKEDRKNVQKPVSDGSTAFALNYVSIYQSYESALSSIDIKIRLSKRKISENKNLIQRNNSTLRFNYNYLKTNGKK